MFNDLEKIWIEELFNNKIIEFEAISSDDKAISNDIEALKSAFEKIKKLF